VIVTILPASAVPTNVGVVSLVKYGEVVSHPIEVMVGVTGAVVSRFELVGSMMISNIADIGLSPAEFDLVIEIACAHNVKDVVGERITSIPLHVEVVSAMPSIYNVTVPPSTGHWSIKSGVVSLVILSISLLPRSVVDVISGFLGILGATTVHVHVHVHVHDGMSPLRRQPFVESA
jgi:hypothetical protein